MIIWLSILGLCFFIELLWRRGYALWLAVIAGFNTLVLSDLSWQITLPLFVVLGSVALVLWHYYCRRPLQHFERHPEERKARNYLHTTFCLSHNINNGDGQELIDDSLWYLKCDQNLPAGTRVKVKTVKGIFLHVTQVQT
ncbi:MAG: NfeD family protein [Gammaproteobacteria bacterium]|nr:NfeD family protein [Gammaproteobacteria bacterium]